tara:strand:- start:363 stop:590 length:228 start_codon:yes stop_codon:yes gene_type:complete
MLYDSIEPLWDKRIVDQLIFNNANFMQANSDEGATITWEDAMVTYEQAAAQPEQTPGEAAMGMFSIMEAMRIGGS